MATEDWRFAVPFRHAVCSPAVVVRLTLSITTARGESWRLIDALRSLMVPTERERGCLRCRLALSSQSSDPARISYTEDWSSEGDLREQVRSERFSRLLGLMESASEAPTLEFELAGGTRGLDYVKEVRGRPTEHIEIDPGKGSPGES